MISKIILVFCLLSKSGESQRNKFSYKESKLKSASIVYNRINNPLLKLFPNDTLNEDLKPSQKYHWIITVGFGAAKYHKIGLLLTSEILVQNSKNFYLGFSIDTYIVLKNFVESKRFFSLTPLICYNEKIFKKNFDFFIGGGISYYMNPRVGAFGLLLVSKLNYDVSNGFVIGIEHKQPLFFGSDYAAPPLMLFNLNASYKFNK